MADAHSEAHEGHGHHIIPMKILVRVFGGLVLLTIITVLTATQLDLGSLNVPVALGIAFTKAALVLTFFMALKYDNKVNSLVFAVGTIFVAVFLIFTLFDTAFRGDLSNVNPQTISDIERETEALQGGGSGAQPYAAGADTTHAASDTTQATPADTTQAAPAAADTTATHSP